MDDPTTLNRPRWTWLTALLGTAGCAVLAVLWQISPAWHRLDVTWLERIQTQTPAPLADALNVVGYGGSQFVAIPSALCIAGYLWHQRQRTRALLWTAAYASGQLVVFALKLSVDRVRPSAPGLLERTFSFPSGHAFTATFLFGSVVLLGWHRWTPGVRWLLVLIASGWALAVGWSRLVHHVHYPTDVLGGFALGMAGLALLRIALRRWAPRHTSHTSVSSSTRSSR